MVKVPGDPHGAPSLTTQRSMIIREQQFQVLTADAAGRFDASLVDHVREKFPFPAAYVPREDLARLVDDSTAKAHGYGFQAAGPLRFFVDCAVLLGAGFDEDPLFFWIRDILDDQSDNDEMTKASRLHMHVDNYLGTVYGARGELALPGLQKIATASSADLAGAGASFETLIAWLRAMHPEKCDYAGKAALETLAATAQTDAVQAGFPPGKGAALLAGLRFAFGAGVLSDPLFPWLAATWGDRTVAPEDRFDRLVQRSQAYMRRVLQVVTAAQDASPSRGL